MLPKNRLGRQMLSKLKVYAGPDHPHHAQKPEPLPIDPRPRPRLIPARKETPSMTQPLTQTTGRRKRAVARVRLRDGAGKITINGRDVEDFFPNATHRMILSEPLRITETAEIYDVDATLHGGGHQRPGRRGAPGHRPGLIELDPELRAPLKQAGFLTRDAREKESKKYGLKKARKAPQYSKR